MSSPSLCNIDTPPQWMLLLLDHDGEEELMPPTWLAPLLDDAPPSTPHSESSAASPRDLKSPFRSISVVSSSSPSNVTESSMSSSPSTSRSIPSTPTGFEPRGYNIAKNKTAICFNLFLHGACQRGPNCQFAHSMWELKPVLVNRNYKIRSCRNNACADKICSFANCMFYHDNEKLKCIDNISLGQNVRQRHQINSKYGLYALYRMDCYKQYKVIKFVYM